MIFTSETGSSHRDPAKSSTACSWFAGLFLGAITCIGNVEPQGSHPVERLFSQNWFLGGSFHFLPSQPRWKTGIAIVIRRSRLLISVANHSRKVHDKSQPNILLKSEGILHCTPPKGPGFRTAFMEYLGPNRRVTILHKMVKCFDRLAVPNHFVRFFYERELLCCFTSDGAPAR